MLSLATHTHWTKIEVGKCKESYIKMTLVLHVLTCYLILYISVNIYILVIALTLSSSSTTICPCDLLIKLQTKVKINFLNQITFEDVRIWAMRCTINHLRVTVYFLSSWLVLSHKLQNKGYNNLHYLYIYIRRNKKIIYEFVCMVLCKKSYVTCLQPHDITNGRLYV